MLTGTKSLPDNLVIRPARPEDNDFLKSLYRSERNDLRMIEAAADFIEELISIQYLAKTQGYADRFPNAMYFLVERLGVPIGRLVVNFGHDAVRLVDIAFVPEARGLGYGTHVIKTVQFAAARIQAPVALTVSRDNVSARRAYSSLGFLVEWSDAISDHLVWHPGMVDTYPNPAIVIADT